MDRKKYDKAKEKMVRETNTTRKDLNHLQEMNYMRHDQISLNICLLLSNLIDIKLNHNKDYLTKLQSIHHETFSVNIQGYFNVIEDNFI